MFEEEELRAMSPEDRVRLVQAIAEIDGIGAAGRPRSMPRGSARRRL